MGGVSWYKLVVYILLFIKTRTYFCKSIAIEIGVSRYFSKVSGVRGQSDSPDYCVSLFLMLAEVNTQWPSLLEPPPLQTAPSRLKGEPPTLSCNGCLCVFTLLTYAWSYPRQMTSASLERKARASLNINGRCPSAVQPVVPLLQGREMVSFQENHMEQVRAKNQ